MFATLLSAGRSQSGEATEGERRRASRNVALLNTGESASQRVQSFFPQGGRRRTEIGNPQRRVSAHFWIAFFECDEQGWEGARSGYLRKSPNGRAWDATALWRPVSRH
jgi:hypothetical protein